MTGIPSRNGLLPIAALASAGLAVFGQASAPPARNQQSEQSVMNMARRIQKEVVTLSNYGVFDDIRFSIVNYVVTLKGYASRPTLKSSVEQVVKKVEGVEEVTNKIEVLSLSPNDDNIRGAVYAAIYFHPVLSRYNPNRGTPQYRSLAQRAGGITNDPPLGFHPIHIIVKGGNVTLTGVVDNASDKSIAGIQANTVAGVFSVENDLAVAQESKPVKNKSKTKS
jgi:hyperosmotically inducible periplasmic protein